VFTYFDGAFCEAQVLNKPAIKQRPPESPFDIRENRALISLGPLSAKKFCTYSCPFCYVHTDFLSYGSLDRKKIVRWLSERRGDFDIVYVSGDTDSFAPPRTEEGIALLRDLLPLDVDVMFTTRAVFTPSQLDSLESISSDLGSAGHYLFGCVSVVQLTFRHIEPPPIPPSEQRLAQLCAFKGRGIVAVLAGRPFLPNVPANETVQIVRTVERCVDAVLGEVWYFDSAGILERQVFQGSTPPGFVYIGGRMDFDINDAKWNIYEGTETRESVEAFCRSAGIPFFMRSLPAIEWIRNNGPRKIPG